jgi:MFS transporter, ACS family, tartrate transporter
MTAQQVGVGDRARRRVAYRLLPFVFLLYVVNYIDRVNVSFANLGMSADLHFSDKVYGLGVGVFYITYVLFEIPGALIVERWSAKKWIARILISWGLVTMLTGFVHSAREFYVARFLLGLAEASFFPGMIVYLTHWFCLRDRSRAIACLYAAVPVSSMVGAPIAGWLLGVHWHWLAGWRWLFIVEGIPAIILGIATLLYLTDRPWQAKWLPADERDWLTGELQAELAAKKKLRDYSILEAFCDRRVLLLTAAWFLALSGILGNIYWVPTFLKRVSGFSTHAVTSLMILSGFVGFVIVLVNGWHADKTMERRWHAAIPIMASGLIYGLVMMRHDQIAYAVPLLLLGSALYYGFYPCFWSIPTLLLSDSAAAATFGLINSIGQLGGFAGPFLIGYLNEKTHSLGASFGVVALSFIGSGFLVLSSRAVRPQEVAPVLESSETVVDTV